MRFEFSDNLNHRDLLQIFTTADFFNVGESLAECAGWRGLVKRFYPNAGRLIEALFWQRSVHHADQMAWMLWDDWPFRRGERRVAGHP